MDVKGRASIHRDTREDSTESSTAAPTNLNGVSQDELSEHYESDNENRSQRYEEPKVERSPPNKLNKRNNRNTKRSPIGNPNNTSFGNKFGDPLVLESALPESSSGLSLFKIIGPIVIGAIVIIYAVWNSNYSVKAEVARECLYSKLLKKYPSENDYLWDPLKFGIEDILNNRSDKPAVFLFVHNGTKKAIQLINDIATTSSGCFDSSPNIQNIDFKSKKATEDYGYIIEKYKQTIKEGNVILIANLNEIPAAAAKALHAICDTFSPMVKKVIIMLSLSAKREGNDEKIIYTAENALKRLWEAELDPSDLDPIITRVTDQVLLLQTN